MKHLIDKAPRVAEAFFNLSTAIRESSALDNKTNQLVQIAIFTVGRSLKGIQTHVERALAAGATPNEIISAIYLALPVSGVASVTMALSEAMEYLNIQPVET